MFDDYDDDITTDLDSEIAVEFEDDSEVELLKAQHAEVSDRAGEIIAILNEARAEDIGPPISKTQISDLKAEVNMLNELANTMFTPEELEGDF